MRILRRRWIIKIKLDGAPDLSGLMTSEAYAAEVG